MSDQSEREALERAATALWKEKRGTSSRPFEWEDSRQWWEEDARIVIDAHRTALAAREADKLNLKVDTERLDGREFLLTLSHGAIYAEWGPAAVVDYRDGEQIRVVEVQADRDPKP